MRITIYCIGKKHDTIFALAINDYLARVARSVTVIWEYIPPSGLAAQQARTQESALLIKRIRNNEIVWLLDETGTIVDSPTLAQKITDVQQSAQNLAIIIGGAYGVSDELKNKADFIWSLSKLVFPHQLVRVIILEQLYRAYEINRGSGYHHE